MSEFNVHDQILFMKYMADQLANIRISVELLRKEFSEVKSQTEYLANQQLKKDLVKENR